MRPRVSITLLALTLSAGFAAPAAAQRKPTVTIMPTQFFSADAISAAEITKGLTEGYERQGYTVMDGSRASQQFTSLGLQASQHYGDRTAVSFGKAMGADLVVYPRLLALGLPATDPNGSNSAPEAVLHLRVLNVHSQQPIYCRQIGHQFSAEPAPDFHLAGPVASSTADEVTSFYFQRVAGSRQELKRTR